MVTNMMTNQIRIESVEDLVETFCDRMGFNMEDEDHSTIAGDMICNILHWVQAKTGKREDALSAMQNGIGNYVTETYIDYDADVVDELGPEAYVSIGVGCTRTEPNP